MLLSMTFFKNSFRRLKKIQQTLLEEQQKAADRAAAIAEGKKVRETKPFDVSLYSRRIKTDIFDMAMAIEEFRNFSSTEPALTVAASMINVYKERLANLKTLDDCVSFLETVIAPLNAFDEMDTYYRYSNWSYDSTFSENFNRWGEDGAMNPDMIAKLRAALHANRTINVMDPYCRAGQNLLNLKLEADSVEIYGIDERKCVDITNKPKFKRIAYGGINKTNITNDAFDVMLLNPNITINAIMKANVYEKAERDYLKKSMQFLRENGVMLYAIPYYRFYKEICTFLAKNLKDIKLYTTDWDMARTKDIYVLGIKKTKAEREEEDYQEDYARLRNLVWDWRRLAVVNPEKFEDINLPLSGKRIDHFRGSELDEDELNELYKKSTCTASFWKDQTSHSMRDSKKRPLLPFNCGQLGLVMTSGCLDGKVDEGNGYCHVIKGRVVKRVDHTNDVDVDSNRVEVVSTTSNRVQINAFLPDGTFKCLA